MGGVKREFLLHLTMAAASRGDIKCELCSKVGPFEREGLHCSGSKGYYCSFVCRIGMEKSCFSCQQRTVWIDPDTREGFEYCSHKCSVDHNASLPAVVSTPEEEKKAAKCISCHETAWIDPSTRIAAKYCSRLCTDTHNRKIPTYGLPTITEEIALALATQTAEKAGNAVAIASETASALINEAEKTVTTSGENIRKMWAQMASEGFTITDQITAALLKKAKDAQTKANQALGEMNAAMASATQARTAEIRAEKALTKAMAASAHKYL
ncbi:MAG: hypothetical protein Hyperionvirus4_34 [Hyperionvirus sp.]|uniref:Uncharacterized protein n=1 Tax=Hyperionvirus sp. TaxID=2487770 RepID=A0A3G5ACK1_9VIRU|nr:MAG: hypothetical protein Hyperionvirus4_34 [Hyperionvirus sp.]